MTAPPPTVWLTRDFLRPRVPGALRVHRRALRGYGGVRSRPAHLAGVARAVVDWRRGGAARALAETRDQAARFAEATGLPEPVVHERLGELAAHLVHPRDALLLGLPLPGRTWSDFVTHRHPGWNLAAGGWRSRADLSLLGDKERTLRRLRAAGLPVTPAVALQAGQPAGDTVRDFLGRHGAAFVKPNVGARGEGAFKLADGRATAHQAAGAGVPLDEWLAAAPTEDLLLQPLLHTHRALASDADPHDVVTLRVVTRDLGRGPEAFSAALEVPTPLVDGTPARYLLLEVGNDGEVVGPATPPWIGRPESDPATAWAGRPVPGTADAIALARRAHAVVPSAFAVAWDVAITDDGPVFLEGNGGFGTHVPQWIAGGLLAGMA